MLGVAVVTILAGACARGERGSSAGASSVAEIHQVTTAERSAAIAGVRKLGEASGVVAGRFAANGRAGVVTAPVFPQRSSSQTVELRMVDGALYVARLAVPAAERDATDLAALDFYALRERSDRPWLKVARPVLIPTVGTPLLLGPFALLDALLKAEATLSPGVVDGDDRTRHVVNAPRLTTPYRISTLEIWVDGSHRLRRVRGVAGNAELDYAVGDFGIAVQVALPPADETTDVLPRVGPSPPEVVGAFTTLASGRSAGLAWQLAQAPGTSGATCWKLETVPAVDLLRPDPVCVAAAGSAAGGRGFAVRFPFQSGATGALDIVVGVVPEPVRAAQLAFVDGSTAAPTYLDQKHGIVLWAGRSRPFLGAGTITLADGATLSCGPGDVIAIGQLAGKSEQELLEYRGYPWSCVED